MGLNPGEGMDVCKCIVPLRQGTTQKQPSSRKSSREVVGRKRGESPLDHLLSLGHPSLPPTNLGRVHEEMASPGGRPLQHSSATRELLATDLVIMNHDQVTRTTLGLVRRLLTTTPHHTNGKTFEFLTNLTRIASLNGRSSAVLVSNSLHSGHESVALTTSLLPSDQLY
ncbi:hypothetical protein TNCV_4615581 [Trichonephila clavipes]|nr:hypothetical protein TNCV_4615581 [Trichonephila clavipes]